MSEQLICKECGLNCATQRGLTRHLHMTHKLYKSDKVMSLTSLTELVLMLGGTVISVDTTIGKTCVVKFPLR